MGELFDDVVTICPGMVLLPGFADSQALDVDIQAIREVSPLRRMQTMRGFLMSVQTTSCGQVGWVADRQGYRYEALDPLTGNAWPAMPLSFLKLSSSAAHRAGFADFVPDSCLINHYEPGTQMGAHQDKDEVDFDSPIVSVSLGIGARFFVVGPERKGKSTAVDLSDGDVVVFGGPARQYYHGVRKLKPANHPHFGPVRWNLTFRKAR